MAYYLVRGVNGVIIHYDFFKAQSCQRYIHKSTIKKFDLLKDAEQAGLEHLRDILPYNVFPPEHLDVNQMVTIAKLDRAQKEGPK